MFQLVAESFEHLDVVTLCVHFKEDAFAPAIRCDFLQDLIKPAHRNNFSLHCLCARPKLLSTVSIRF